MRSKTTEQEYFNWSGKSSLKVVKEYKNKYERIDEILRENPTIIALAHRDLAATLSESSGGRVGRYTSEEILRVMIVQVLEQESYCGLVTRIDTSEFLRGFVGLGVKPMMDYTFICRAFGVIEESTWQAINRQLSAYAKSEGKINGEKLRLDATVYETNIHYPTDSSLLWDSFRTLARLLRLVQGKCPELRHRFHDKKAKKMAYYIARNGGSNSKRKQQMVKTTYRTLIERVEWIYTISREVTELYPVVYLTAPELFHYIPIVERIIDQSRRRVLMGEKVPANEKIYSLFEEHTELLKRGKARKDIEFGHKILLAQTGEKFIHHYEVLPQNRTDTELLEPALATHTTLFGEGPKVLAADKGFYQSMEQIKSLEAQIETVSMGKKGRRNQAETKRETSDNFKAGQRFRAGCEGSISVLKRAFRLGLCFFKGFKNYAASVGCSVFSHNLVLLSRL